MHFVVFRVTGGLNSGAPIQRVSIALTDPRLRCPCALGATVMRAKMCCSYAMRKHHTQLHTWLKSQVVV